MQCFATSVSIWFQTFSSLHGSHSPSCPWVCVPYILPTSGLTAHSCRPFPRFLKGLPVRPALLSDEVKAALDVAPTPGVIKYIIATQVRPGTSPQPQGPGAPAAQPAHRP